MNYKFRKIPFSKKNISRSRQENGVYLFLNKTSHPVYIGKSKNLRRRLESYLANPLSKKTSEMIHTAKFFSTVYVSSELEALLLEAKLVKIYNPKFNIQLKDDKHPLYIKISKELYPRILTARKKDKDLPPSVYFGPFPSSKNVRGVLTMLRKIFPFAQHRLGKKPCIYSQMNLCNPCPNEIERGNKASKAKLKKTYKKNIRLLTQFLKGNISTVRNSLLKEMQVLAEKEKFEKARLIKQKIAQIDYITQPVTSINFFLQNPNLLSDIRAEELATLSKILKKCFKNVSKIQRIECYDVAHLAGTKPTASMVTFINGEADTSLYRRFKIKQKKGASDTDSLTEVVKRRIKYLSTWGIPDLIIIDGGRGQVSSFLKQIDINKIPVVGLAKSYEKLVIPTHHLSKSSNFTQLKLSKGPALNLVKRIRNEAHRFAQSYHHTLVKKDLLAFSEKKQAN